MILNLIHIKPSIHIFYGLLSVSLLSVGAIISAALPWYLKILLITGVLNETRRYSLRYIFNRHLLSVTSLYKSNAGFWCLYFRTCIMHGYLQPNTIVTTFLIILKFRLENSRRVTLILTPQSIGQKSYRHLLTQLLHGKNKSG